MERETARAKALAEAEGRALEARKNEDINRRLFKVGYPFFVIGNILSFASLGAQLHARLCLPVYSSSPPARAPSAPQDRAVAERDRAVSVARATLSSLYSGTTELLGDPQRLAAGAAALGAAALAIYASREATKARVVMGLRSPATTNTARFLTCPSLSPPPRSSPHSPSQVAGALIQAYLSTPPLVRETTRRSLLQPSSLLARRGAGYASEEAAAAGAAGAHGAPRPLCCKCPPARARRIVFPSLRIFFQS